MSFINDITSSKSNQNSSGSDAQQSSSMPANSGSSSLGDSTQAGSLSYKRPGATPTNNNMATGTQIRGTDQVSVTPKPRLGGTTFSQVSANPAMPVSNNSDLTLKTPDTTTSHQADMAADEVKNESPAIPTSHQMPTDVTSSSEAAKTDALKSTDMGMPEGMNKDTSQEATNTTAKPEPVAASMPANNNQAKMTTALLSGLVVFLVGAVSWLGYLYYEEKNAGPADYSDAEVQEIMQKLSQSINVPEGETPSVGTVLDANLLKERSPKFYKDAEKGDKLVVFSDRVILYDDESGVVKNMVLVDTEQLLYTASKNQEGNETGGDADVAGAQDERQ